MLEVNYYYDNSPDKALSSDPEGNLVMLCRHCAWVDSRNVAWASRGDSESVCEICNEEQADVKPV